MSRLLLIGLTVAALALAPAVLARGGPVLGERGVTGPFGAGWGTSRPGEILTGSDPRVMITKIHWITWGASVAVGVGRNALTSPQGGYSDKIVTIHLRASDLGRCTARGPLAYRRLAARENSRPGGPLGKWFGLTIGDGIC